MIRVKNDCKLSDLIHWASGSAHGDGKSKSKDLEQGGGRDQDFQCKE